MSQRNSYHLFILLAVFQSSSSQRRIKDGKEVISDKKYVVYLLRASSAPNHYHGWLCGGAIISKDYVITSAACVQDVRHMYVIPGYKNYVAANKLHRDNCIREKKKKVILTCVPTNYQFEFDRTEVWSKVDIAVIKVESPFDFNDKSYVKVCSYTPQPIDFNTEIEFPEPGDNVIVFGWGHNKEFRQDQELIDMNQATLHYASTRVLDDETCVKHFQGNKELASFIASSMLCTLKPGNLDDKGELVLRSQRDVKECVTEEARLEGVVGRICDKHEIAKLSLHNAYTTASTAAFVSMPEKYEDTSIKPTTTTLNLSEKHEDLSTKPESTTIYFNDDPARQVKITSSDEPTSQEYVKLSDKSMSLVENTHLDEPIPEVDALYPDELTPQGDIMLPDESTQVGAKSLSSTLFKKLSSNPVTLNTDQGKGYLITKSRPTIINSKVDGFSNEDDEVIVARRQLTNYLKSRNGNVARDLPYWNRETTLQDVPKQQDDPEPPNELEIGLQDEPASQDELLDVTTSEDNTELQKDTTLTLQVEHEQEIDTATPDELALEEDIEPLDESTSQVDIDDPPGKSSLQVQTTPPDELNYQLETEPPDEATSQMDTEPPSGPTPQVDRDPSDESIPQVEITLPDELTPQDTKSPDETTPQIVTEPPDETMPQVGTITPDEVTPQAVTMPLDESKPQGDTETSSESTLQVETTSPEELKPQDEEPSDEAKPQVVTETQDEAIPQVGTDTPDESTPPAENTPPESKLQNIDTTITLPIEPTPQVDITLDDPRPPTAQNITGLSDDTQNVADEEYTPGICQNDHGGPLVAWKDGKEVLVAVATLYKLDSNQQCIGPYLFTKTSSNAAFIKCIVDDNTKNASRRSCDEPEEIGFKIVRRHISWVGHSDGPAENEQIHVRDQVPIYAYQPRQPWLWP